MVVLVILGLLAAFVAPKILGRGEEAKVTATKAQLHSLDEAVHQYELDIGALPKELKDLVEQPSDAKRWRQGGYLEHGRIPKDGWGNEFAYRIPGTSNHEYDLYSKGRDGEEGGEELDKDIFSRDE
ncbi:MAG: type II secretion system major pseudopilin GspG [Deltaproteobacteria bacterium]|nr:type II secretion system major pseudopilin GspG [Deltaproteobacteria bacterium]